MAPPRRGPDSPPRLLWVEGKDDSAVVQGLCEKVGVPEVFSVHQKEGIEKLLAGIGVELRQRRLDRFGVVVDANGDAGARWASIRRTLEEEGYPEVPATIPAEGAVLPAPPRLPRFGAWIMPDNTSSGALEEFAARLVPPGDALFQRAGEAIDAIPEEHRRFPPARRAKAHIHTWLAWQENPGSPMGQAIGKDDLDAGAPAAQAFVAWLRRLMVDE